MSRPFQNSSAGFTLRVVLTTLALVQIYSYALVVFYTLFVGGVDILLPVRLAFAATIASLVMLSIGDVNTAWKNRNVDWGQLGLSVYRLVGEIGTLLGLIVLTFLFLINPLSSVNLSTVLTPEEKVVVVIGIISLLAFTVIIISDLLAFRREGTIPKLLPSVGSAKGSSKGAKEASD